MSLIELDNITKVYKRGRLQEPALRGVNLKIEDGEFVAIMGPSGSGKSTLLNIIGTLDRPTGGSYRLGGHDISKLKDRTLAKIRNDDIGFVFQSFHLLPRLTALQNVLLPMIYSKEGPDRSRGLAMLDQVGLHGKEKSYPNELSGGEQQRVAIARALILDPKLILADEPTGNLDTKTSQEIMALLNKIHRAGNTILMITHEADIAAVAGRQIKMRDGKIISSDIAPTIKPSGEKT